MSRAARTPDPPYYAVIFTSLRTDADDEGYGVASDRMQELGSKQPGYLGYESARGSDGLGITVSSWESEEAIANWRRNAEHRVVQGHGYAKWYSEFFTRVARVDRAYDFTKPSR